MLFFKWLWVPKVGRKHCLIRKVAWNAGQWRGGWWFGMGLRKPCFQTLHYTTSATLKYKLLLITAVYYIITCWTCWTCTDSWMFLVPLSKGAVVSIFDIEFASKNPHIPPGKAKHLHFYHSAVLLFILYELIASYRGESTQGR